MKRLQEYPEIAMMPHGDAISTLQWRHGTTCGQRAVVRFYLSLELVRLCEIKLSHKGKKNGNPDLVCDNKDGFYT